MDTMEEQLWNEIVKSYVVTGPGASLLKSEQQALAAALQRWTAQCVVSHLQTLLAEQERSDLEHYIQKDVWRIHHQGKDFLGAVRGQEVDVWMANAEAGLILAVDPKHFQSQDSLKKNWKNGHNDLVAFATNLHERFPLCAVGGVISFPEWAADPRDLKQMHSICGRSIPRERPLNAYGKFEGFALAVYDAAGNLTWPFRQDSPLKPYVAFTALANAVYTRTVALL